MTAVFRAHSASDALRSDRSARDRQRHRHKVRKAIRESIADVVAEEAIIGQRRDKILKVPIRGIKEYRFVYGDQAPGVGTGTGDTKPGEVVGQVDLVLRFLAEDLAKEFHSVLDGILRSMSSRRAPTVPIHALTVVRGPRP